VFAVLPGLTYNLIRDAALHPDPIEGDKTLFEAIVLRPPPPQAANADGSLSFDALKLGGFLYRNQQTFPDAVQQQPFWNAFKKFVAKTIATAVQDVGRAITDGLGEIDRFIAGKVTVDISFTVLNRDRVFETDKALTVAWGTRAGEEMHLSGTRVEIRQWLDGASDVGIPVPTSFFGTLHEDGRISLDVAKGANSRDGGLCIELANDAAALTSFILPNDTCDFQDAKFGGFKQDVAVPIRTNLIEMHHLTLATDARAYVTNVTGFVPHHADIAVGWLFDQMQARDRSYTACFGFPSITATVLPTILERIVLVREVGELVPGGKKGDPLNAYLLLLADSFFAVSAVDIVLSNDKSNTDSRGLMPHEYGHFLQCSLLVSEAPLALSKFLLQQAFDGRNLDPSQAGNAVSEAFADFFSARSRVGWAISSHFSRACRTCRITASGRSAWRATRRA
jgi:hypothetical protein